MTLTLLGLNGVPVDGLVNQTTSFSDGQFYLCAPANTPFYVEASLAGYQTCDSPILSEPGGPDQYFTFYSDFAVISNSDLGAFGGFLTNPTLVSADSMIIVLVAQFEGPGCNSGVGYSVGVALPDGGTLPDGGPLPFAVTYINGEFPDPVPHRNDRRWIGHPVQHRPDADEWLGRHHGFEPKRAGQVPAPCVHAVGHDGVGPGL